MKTKLRLASLIVASILMGAGVSHANNLQIGTPTQPAANQIQFTISWSNAWNNSSGTPNNWDAAWVFVKQQDCTNSAPQPWNHVTLSATPSLHTITGGSGNLQIDTSSDGLGVFIRVTNASSPFLGSVSGTVTLTFASTPANTDNYKVFGIEMVYVPQGSFFVGDGSSTSSYTNFQITSEAAISSVQIGGTSGSLVAAYPKGFNAFYCMKYEITQHQWVDFLNTLNYSQQAALLVSAPSWPPGSWAMGPNLGQTGFNRNSIKVMSSGTSTGNFPATYGCDLGNNTGGSGAANNTYNETFDGQDIACNFLSCTDLISYLAWSALRPMTDLEYEKACRGPLASLPLEYAWGLTTIINGISYAAGNSTTDALKLNGINEVPLNIGQTGVAVTGTGLCVFGWGSSLSANSASGGLVNFGPMRVGSCATSTTTRTTAGATYWGILDMTGNVWERTVNTYASAPNSPFCYNFGNTGTLHGTGSLTIPASWPNASDTNYNVRGGSWEQTGTIGTVSYRGQFTQAVTFRGRVEDVGGRGVHTHQ